MMDQETLFDVRSADLKLRVRLYAVSVEKLERSVRQTWRCRCFMSKDIQVGGWDAVLRVGAEPLHPNKDRCVEAIFLSEDGAEHVRRAGRVYLWDRAFVGKALVVN